MASAFWINMHEDVKCVFLCGAAELGLSDGQELAVADITTPQTVLFKLNFIT